MDELWLAVRWLHVLAMAFFVGGQLFLAAIVVPVERRATAPERLRAIARRFGYGTLVAIGLLLATGPAMASHFDRWSDGTLQLKLSLVGLVAGLLVWHTRRPTMHAGGRCVRALARDRVARPRARTLSERSRNLQSGVHCRGLRHARGLTSSSVKRR